MRTEAGNVRLFLAVPLGVMASMCNARRSPLAVRRRRRVRAVVPDNVVDMALSATKRDGTFGVCVCFFFSGCVRPVRPVSTGDDGGID